MERTAPKETPVRPTQSDCCTLTLEGSKPGPSSLEVVLGVYLYYNHVETAKGYYHLGRSSLGFWGLFFDCCILVSLQQEPYRAGDKANCIIPDCSLELHLKVGPKILLTLNRSIPTSASLGGYILKTCAGLRGYFEAEEWSGKGCSIVDSLFCIPSQILTEGSCHELIDSKIKITLNPKP